ncbi:MAG: alanyl-tRNA editing protein [Candidatus Woesearchaeota archaeon]
MRTKLLTMEDSYIKEFDAKVIESKDNYVILDVTGFYPESGGQPSDTGSLNNIKVLQVTKKDEIRHILEKNDFKENDIVHGVIDWDKRYKYCRMHSAQHILSAIVFDKYNAVSVGNQLGYDKSRIDLFPFKPNKEILEDIIKEFNNIINKHFNIIIRNVKREEMMGVISKRNSVIFNKLPKTIEEVRVVEIGDFDRIPCAGTHVKNTKEIGYINIIDTENKGKDITRLSFELK